MTKRITPMAKKQYMNLQKEHNDGVKRLDDLLKDTDPIVSAQDSRQSLIRTC